MATVTDMTGASLSPAQLLAAFYDFARAKDADIAEAVGVSQQTIYRWRALPAYKARLIELTNQLEANLSEQAMSLGARYNALAHKATDTIATLNESADTDSVRLNAAKLIMDIAPDAPKPRKHGGEALGTVIQIGTVTLNGMKDALRDVGEPGVVDLIEGGDFREVMVEQADGGVGGNGRYGPIEPREA